MSMRTAWMVLWTLAAAMMATAADETRVVCYGIFDPERDPDLVSSHAGAGLRDIKFVAEPKKSGPGSMELDVSLAAKNTSGRWIYPIPNAPFRGISFWISAPDLGGATLELLPSLLGGDRQTYHFKPVAVSASAGWQKVSLRVPEDVTKLANDPGFADPKQLTPEAMQRRKHLLFSFAIRLAPASKAASWQGRVFLSELEFSGDPVETGAPRGPAKTARATTGTPVLMRMKYQHPANEMAYFIVDDGEGNWIPTAQGISEYTLNFNHSYTRPGPKDRRWISVGIGGGRSPWFKAPVIVTGGPLPPVEPLHAAFRTSALKTNAADFTGTVRGKDSRDKLWIAAMCDGGFPIDHVELKPPSSGNFPRDFEIETTSDGGASWQAVPAARFLHFPNPGDRVVRIPLHGVVADGVRVTSYRRDDDEADPASLNLGGISLFAAAAPLFDAMGADPGRMAAWNNLWLTFGSAENEIHERFDSTWPTGRPYSGGMLAILTAEWSFWNALKMSWRDNAARMRLAQNLVSLPVDDGGYVWLTPHHDKHLEHSRHYVATPIWISAVAYHYLLTRDKAFLESKDPKTGEPLLSKVRRAMAMLTDKLGGSGGLVTIRDPELQGTPDCKGNTYWDAWPFGHKDAYMNAHFYEACGWYADLMEAAGDPAESARLRSLRPLIRETFNSTFWDGEKGRYIGWIDKDGKRVDFGFVFLNLKAVSYGLADGDRATRVMQWIDGGRSIPGDTSGGEDIYHYKIAPRSTTRAAESEAAPYFKLFWGDDTVATRDSPASWGLNAQNGGMIFYVSYYDLHARKRALGPDNAMKRMNVILEETAKDHLRRMPKNPTIGIGTAVGILREFPESGIVPFYFVDGVMGIRPAPGGLRITPAIPEAWRGATVESLSFAGADWTITADSSVEEPAITRAGDGSRRLVVPANKTTLLTPDGTTRTEP